MASFIAAGTAYASHGLHMIPFFTYYSMFGFQRIGDLIWLAGDIRAAGTVCRILQVGKQPDGILQVIVEGVTRAHITGFPQEEPHFEVEIALQPDVVEKTVELEALMRGLVSQFERFARLSRSIPADQLLAVTQAEEPGRLADLVAQHLSLKLDERQEILEADVKTRLERLSAILSRETHVLELERKIQNRVRKQMEKSQREYFLKEQIKAIQQELGETDERQAEVSEYEAGTLVLDVVDTRTNRVIWRGWAQDAVGDMLEDRDTMERKINEAVTRILARLPGTL